MNYFSLDDLQIVGTMVEAYNFPQNKYLNYVKQFFLFPNNIYVDTRIRTH